jgi:predicted phosphodiesterase
MRSAQQGQRYDYLLHGHTHVRRDERAGRTRIINPGRPLPPPRRPGQVRRPPRHRRPTA